MSADVFPPCTIAAVQKILISVFETALTGYDDIMMLDLDKASMFV